MPETAQQQDRGQRVEHRYEIRLPVVLYGRLRKIAAANERSLAGEVRHSLERHAQHEEQRLGARDAT